ncbi:MAG TPA: sugar ABC transporter substrate-binding protein, partial [Gemmatimonadaceae bacterium]
MRRAGARCSALGARRGRLVLASLVVLACADASARDETVLEFWGMGREGEVVETLVRDFERENPGIRVRVQQIPWTAAHEKLLTAHVGGATPDVAQLGNTWIPEFQALDALEPLDAWVARSDVVDPADYFRGIWQTNVVESVLYGVPWYVDTRVIFYRTDLLREAGYDAVPTTWAGWRTALERLRARAEPGAWPALLPTNEWALTAILGLQAGSPLLRDGGRYGAFSDSAFRRGFEYYIGLFRDSLAPPFADRQVSNIFQEFARGRFAMYITGPWNVGEFRRRLPPDVPWTTAPLPGPTGAESGASNAGGSSLVLFRGSPNPAAAWKLVEFLSRPDVQLEFSRLTGDLPARQSAWQDSTLIGDREMRAFYEQLQRVEPLPKVPEIELIVQKLAEHAERVIHGGVS